jgi:signal transduction histidine kinase
MEGEPVGLASEVAWSSGAPLGAGAPGRLRARLGRFAGAGLAFALVGVALSLRQLLVASFGERVDLGVFLAMGLLVAALAHRSHRAQERAAAAERERDLRIGEVVLRDQAAERAARLVRVRLALTEYAPSHTLDELLRRTLDEVVRLTGSAIGFYHFVEVDQRTLSLQTWSTRTVREFCTAKGTGLHHTVDAAGVWADALRERRAVVHDDYAALPHRRGLPEGHAPVLRELVVPVMRDDRVVALVGVGNKAAGYTPEDVDVVSYLADACWEAVARKRAEETRDQLEQQLRQAQKLESIGRLAGGIAHDFNNLLTVILSCARGAEDALRTGGPVDPEDLEEIRRAGERARDLTRRLLLFARKQSADPVAIDVNGVVRSVEGLLRRVLGDDIELRVDPQGALWPVLFDPGLLEQVLLNFAVNARDAMPEGGTLLIGTRNATVEPNQRDRGPEDLPGDWVRIVVRDTGIGMTAEARAHLFEPFFTTKEVGKGTGLGLAMVHGIVSQAGGHVHVETEPGRGTTFEVCLPRAAREAVAPERAAEAGDAPSGSETVLVVEDEAVVRIVVARALQDAGYTVLEASNPTDALELFREEPRRIDLVVTDVRMLGQSGPAMAKVMRRLRPDVRVLYVSGFPGDQAELAAGDGFLAKPFSREALRGHVRAILDRGGTPAPPA